MYRSVAVLSFLALSFAIWVGVSYVRTLGQPAVQLGGVWNIPLGQTKGCTLGTGVASKLFCATPPVTGACVLKSRTFPCSPNFNTTTVQVADGCAAGSVNGQTACPSEGGSRSIPGKGSQIEGSECSAGTYNLTECVEVPSHVSPCPSFFHNSTTEVSCSAGIPATALCEGAKDLNSTLCRAVPATKKSRVTNASLVAKVKAVPFYLSKWFGII